MAMSSLVQRQSERQGIFFVALSPLERGAGGVKYQPYLLYPPPKTLVQNHPPPENSGGVREGFIHPRPFSRHYI